MGDLHPYHLDIMTFVGTIGLFLMLLFLFIRVLPAISIFEMRELVHHKGHAKEETVQQGQAAD